MIRKPSRLCPICGMATGGLRCWRDVQGLAELLAVRSVYDQAQAVLDTEYGRLHQHIRKEERLREALKRGREALKRKR